MAVDQKLITARAAPARPAGDAQRWTDPLISAMDADQPTIIDHFAKQAGFTVWHYVQYVLACLLANIFILLGMRYAEDLSLKTFFWMFLACGAGTVLLGICAYRYISTVNGPEFRQIRKSPGLSMGFYIRSIVPPKNIRSRHRWLMPLWVVVVVGFPVNITILWIRIAAMAN